MVRTFSYKAIDAFASKLFKEKYELTPNYCYENIMNIAFDYAENNYSFPYQIAYGYYGNLDYCMTRHCFLVLGDVIIDPTSYEQAIKGEFSYQIFKAFSIREYVSHFTEYYSRLNENLNIAPWFEYSMEEEECYCRYLIENQIPVNTFSYKEFLSKYDVDGKVKVENRWMPR